MAFGQLREGNSTSPPIPCVPSQGPMSQLTVSRLWVYFAPTLGAAPVHSVKLLILYSPFFRDPTKRHFWVFWLFLFLAVSWRAKLQRLSLRSQYLLVQTVPGSVMGSASFQHGDIFVAGGNLFACRCEVVLHPPKQMTLQCSISLTVPSSWESPCLAPSIPSWSCFSLSSFL